MSAWYADGLRFSCTRCGNCCTGTPGYVWVSPKDIKSIARHLELTPRQFQKRYTRLVGHLLCLVDQPGGDCIFLTEGKRCSINEAKPRQCLTFPFWPRLIASAESWRETASGCPGIGSGPLYKPEEIDAIADRDTPRELLCRMFEKKASTS